MRAVFGLVLVLGLGLAGFAVYMVQNYIAGYQTALAKAQSTQAETIKTVDVYVAKKALSYGEVLKPKDVQLVKWPAKHIPEGVFSDQAKLFPNPEDPTTRRVVLRQMEKFEPLLAVKVTKPGEDAGITSRLEKGMRAFAIKVDVASGVSGFLRPGDRVDVYWTGEVFSGTVGARRELTKLIKSSVQLIAVDQTANDDGSEASIARTVTVAVNQMDVGALAQAQSTGTLSLALVGALDDTVASNVEIDQKQLLGIVEEEIAPIEQAAVEEKVCTTRVRRGAEVAELPIPCSN